jgi:hypothetical protein
MYRPAPRLLMLVFRTRAVPLWRYTRTTQRASNPTECQVFRAIRKTILTANLMTGNVATALVSRCFDTAIMLGAYIFDCAKHGAVFDRTGGGPPRRPDVEPRQSGL